MSLSGLQQIIMNLNVILYLQWYGMQFSQACLQKKKSTEARNMWMKVYNQNINEWAWD